MIALFQINFFKRMKYLIKLKNQKKFANYPYKEITIKLNKEKRKELLIFISK